MYSKEMAEGIMGKYPNASLNEVRKNPEAVRASPDRAPREDGGSPDRIP
jgi:hypothetical protein